MASLCPRHPGIPTTDLCVGCGEFVCGQCAYLASDRRVFCPSCKARLSAEELAGLPEAGPARRPARGPVERIPAVEVLPAVEPSSPLAAALKASPASVLLLGMGLVGFGCTPVAVFGAAIAGNELRRHLIGNSHAPFGLVVAAFGLNLAAVALRVLMWAGR